MVSKVVQGGLHLDWGPGVKSVETGVSQEGPTITKNKVVVCKPDKKLRGPALLGVRAS